jgi:simple sugar transport system permease protein
MQVQLQNKNKISGLMDFLSQNAQVSSIAVFLTVCIISFSVSTDAFFTSSNLLNLLRQAAPLMIVAVAMTFVITTGGIDLSVGSSMALANALVAIILAHGTPWPAAVLIVLGIGGLIGLMQGWFIAYEKIPPFIVTLAGLSIFRGIALLMTEGFSIPIDRSSGFLVLGRGWFMGIPIPAILAIIVVIAGLVALSQTTFGRHVIGIGADTESARRAGIPTNRVIISVYVLAGMAAAFAGLIFAARLASGSSNAGVAFELEVIAAVVLGGTSLMGGRGSVAGTVLGALTIVVIGNGLILLHVSPFFTQIVTGAIILIAIWLNTRVFNRIVTTH